MEEKMESKNVNMWVEKANVLIEALDRKSVV